MSTPAAVLLAVLALSACQGRGAAPLPTSSFLEESIGLLSKLLETKASCDKMNVTNIFAGDKQDDDVEILCKASSVALEGRSCHSQLEGLHLNLLSLVRRMRMVHKAPCPAAGGNTTSLRNFLMDLRRVLQRLVKTRG